MPGKAMVGQVASAHFSDSGHNRLVVQFSTLSNFGVSVGRSRTKSSPQRPKSWGLCSFLPMWGPTGRLAQSAGSDRLGQEGKEAHPVGAPGEDLEWHRILQLRVSTGR